jgi:cytochrome b561
MSTLARYHPVLIALHWIMALAILISLGMGLFVLDGMDAADPAKIGLLQAHLLMGVSLLVLAVVRLFTRIKMPQPAKVVTGNPLRDKVGTGVHHLLYCLMIVVPASGLALAYSADLGNILFNHVGKLPKDFEDFTAHEIHGLSANLLMFTIGLHVAAALYHQFILKNGLLSRMSLCCKSACDSKK